MMDLDVQLALQAEDIGCRVYGYRPGESSSIGGINGSPSKVSLVVEVHVYSQTSITRICGDYFYKSESPEVRMDFALRVILTCKT